MWPESRVPTDNLNVCPMEPSLFSMEKLNRREIHRHSSNYSSLRISSESMPIGLPWSTPPFGCQLLSQWIITILGVQTTHRGRRTITNPLPVLRGIYQPLFSHQNMPVSISHDPHDPHPSSGSQLHSRWIITTPRVQPPHVGVARPQILLQRPEGHSQPLTAYRLQSPLKHHNISTDVTLVIAIVKTSMYLIIPPPSRGRHTTPAQ
jgi:hypothetical protein